MEYGELKRKTLWIHPQNITYGMIYQPHLSPFSPPTPHTTWPSCALDNTTRRCLCNSAEWEQLPSPFPCQSCFLKIKRNKKSNIIHVITVPWGILLAIVAGSLGNRAMFATFFEALFEIKARFSMHLYRYRNIHRIPSTESLWFWSTGTN